MVTLFGISILQFLIIYINIVLADLSVITKCKSAAEVDGYVISFACI